MSGVITPTSLGEYTSVAVAASYTPFTFTTAPVAGRGYLLAVDSLETAGYGSDPVLPTVGGTTGLAWVQVATVVWNSSPQRRLTVFKASKASGLTTGTVVVDFGAVTQGGIVCQLHAMVGADAGVDGANLVVQAVTAFTTVLVGTNTTPTLAALEAGTDNITMLFAATNRNVSLAPHSTQAAYLFEVEETQLALGKNTTLGTYWADNLTTLQPKVQVRLADDTADDTAVLAMVALEVRASEGSAPPVLTEPSVVHLQDYTTTGAVASYPFPSFAYANDTAYLMVVHSSWNSASGTATQPTLSGGGLTWVAVSSVQHSNTPIRRVTVFRARKATGATTGVVTIDFAGQTQTCLIATLCRVDNASATGSDGAGMIVQATSEESANTAVASLEAGPLTTPPETGSVLFAAFGASGLNGTMGPSTTTSPTAADGVAELADLTLGSGKNQTLGVYWYPADNYSVLRAVPWDLTGTTITNAKMCSVLIELRGVVTAGSDVADGDTITFDDTGLIITASDDDTVAVSDEARIRKLGGVTLPPGASVSATVDLVVEVRQPDLERIGQITQMVSLELVLRHQDVGTWLLVIPSTDPMAQWLVLPGYGILVRRRGRIIFSGPVRHFTWTLEEGDPDGPPPELMLQVGGPDDTVLLADRVAHPVPLDDLPPYDAQEADVRQGAGESLLYGYVNDNLGPHAVVDRIASQVTLGTDLGRGTPESSDVPAIIGRARWQTVLELAQELAQATSTDLGFEVRQAGLALVFSVYEPLDRTATAVFSQALANLVGFTYNVQAPAATYVYVGAQGEGAARLIVERSADAAAAEWGRIERFVDRRDVPVDQADELTQATITALSDRAQTQALSLTTIDTPRLSYGVHYDVGDRVTVRVGEVSIVDVLREVRLSYVASDSEPSEVITPTVGTNEGITLPRDRELRRLGRAITKLNRS